MTRFLYALGLLGLALVILSAALPASAQPTLSFLILDSDCTDTTPDDDICDTSVNVRTPKAIHANTLTATTLSEPITIPNMRAFYVLIDVVTLSGTSPTVNFCIGADRIHDGFYERLDCNATNMTAAGDFIYFVGPSGYESGNQGTIELTPGVPDTWRAELVFGGTVTNFTADATIVPITGGQ